jgi:molybdopterin synthase catalytic subunit
MQVRVLFFGALRDLMGTSADAVLLPDGSDLSQLLERFSRDKPAVAELLPSLAISVNQEYATRDMKLHDQDEVALLPPVSGGADDLLGQHSAIVWKKIDVPAVAEPLKRGQDGAIVVFEGIVRDNTRGRRTLYLDYHAYESMAVKQMDALVEEAGEKFAVDQARIVHRLGRMEIGETSVLIVVTSAHRGVAFEACRFLIDALKKTVPIWKKEYFADGAVWADGEPFPEQLTNLTNPRQATS